VIKGFARFYSVYKVSLTGKHRSCTIEQATMIPFDDKIH
jgi:hypothetical protein